MPNINDALPPPQPSPAPSGAAQSCHQLASAMRLTDDIMQCRVQLNRFRENQEVILQKIASLTAQREDMARSGVTLSPEQEARFQASLAECKQLNNYAFSLLPTNEQIRRAFAGLDLDTDTDSDTASDSDDDSDSANGTDTDVRTEAGPVPPSAQ